MDSAAIETKLSAARTRLILDKPFLGALVLRLPLVEASPDWCSTTATDARKFYYNAEFIDHLTLDETQFILAHEALHCALSHFARRQHRIKHRWDLACDYAINPLLVADGLKPPFGALYEKSFEGMSAEEIYPYIEDNPDEETLDQHLYDKETNNDDGGESHSPQQSPDEGEAEQGGQGDQPEEEDEQQGQGESDADNNGQGGSSELEQDDTRGGAPQPPPLTEAEKENLQVQWQQRMAGAAQQAMQAGKLGGAMARMVDFLLQPQLPWRMLLARYMSNIARDDYSYSRPSSRREGPAIYPSLRSDQVNLVVAVDISGSVNDKEMGEFISEVNAIKSQIRARISLLACDAQLAKGAPWSFEPWEEFTLPESLSGGGGTSFVPVFQWAEQQDQAPDLLVYFTDAEGEFPAQEPTFPVIWLVKGKATVPWGQRIQLN